MAQDRVQTLGELITEFKQAHNYTWRDLEQLSEGSVAWKTFQIYGTSATRANAPDPATIRGMSTALRIPQRQLWIAAGAQVGLDMGDPDSPFKTMLPGGTEDIPTYRAFLLLSMIRAAVDDAHPKPPTKTPPTKRR